MTAANAELDAARIDQLRSALPALRDAIYLNTGTAGPMPESVAAAMAAEVEEQLHDPRSGPAHGARVRELKGAAREQMAAMLGCDVEETALTHNTTEGMNLVTLGVNWQPGDEAITTDVEHPGALFPLYAARERFNITIKTANVAGKAPDAAVAEVASLMSARTKLVSLSHVSFQTGQLLPVAAIAERAHSRGALLLVDGAQTFGTLHLDVRSLGCDAYAVSGQKWLCGPEGTGALYVSQDVVSQLRIVFASYGTMEGYNDYGGFQVRGNAQRFEQGTANAAEIAGQVAAARFLTEQVGIAEAARRSSALVDYARKRLAELDWVRVRTPEDHAGLVTASLEDGDPEAAVRELANEGVVVRSIRPLRAIRLSLGYFNTEDEVDAAIRALEQARSSGRLAGE